jgi:hypothetical protein
MQNAKIGGPLWSRPEGVSTRKWLRGIVIMVAPVLVVSFAATTAYANCGPMAGLKATPITLPALAYAGPQLALQIAGQGDAIPDRGANHSIVGLWHTLYTANGAPFAETLKQWHSDGTEFENVDHNPAIGSVCLGVWKQVGVRTVRLHHVGWLFAADGSPSGMFTQDETDTVDSDGMSYKGTFTFRTYDQNGAFSGFEVSGTISAIRITVS